MNRIKTLVTAAALVVLPALTNAQNILIINGTTGTSEAGTTANITANLTALHTAVGNTVTVSDGIPANFAAYSQVWDIRFSNNFALTGVQQTQYLTYLQSGGRVFMMGENNGFSTRNGTIFSLIAAAGGGNLGNGGSGTCPADNQTVNAPFTGPNAVSTINYACAGAFNGVGTGQWISNSGAIGAGVAWTIGTLANATAGSLTSILDVNFMEGNRTFEMQQLTKNLIGFVNNPPPPQGVVPEPSTYALMATGLVGLFAARRRRTAVKS
jgi:PEP-CTERM motif